MNFFSLSLDIIPSAMEWYFDRVYKEGRIFGTRQINIEDEDRRLNVATG